MAASRTSPLAMISLVTMRWRILIAGFDAVAFISSCRVSLSCYPEPDTPAPAGMDPSFC